MNKAALQAAYAKICSAEATEDEKKEAHGAIRAHLEALPAEGGGVDESPAEKKDKPGQATPDPTKPGPDEAAAGDNDPGYTDDEKKQMAKIKADAAARKHASGGPDDPGNKWPDNKDKPATGEKTETRAMAAVISEQVATRKELDALKIEKLLDKHPELTPALRAWCATQAYPVVEGFLKAAPVKLAARGTGVVQGEDDGATPGLQGEELAKMNAAMGVGRPNVKQFERLSASEGGGFRIHTVRPSDARALAAAAQK